MKSLQHFVIFVIVALTFYPAAVVGETNFNNCLTKVKNGTYGIGVDIGGTDNHGNPVNVSLATGVTYSLCIDACGAGQEPFNWTVFSQQFTSWLLPWLALISQLPFGANDKLDNLESVLLTVGSPTLAAYSLALTVMNGRWIEQHLGRYTANPNVRNAIRILSSLQQSPLEIETEHGLLASLVVLPQNKKWWSELKEGINYTHTWSISAINNIAWVIIAYIFTLIDSFTTGKTNFINANGQAVGSLWLWLLPVVIGWLQVSPKCDSTRLSSAVEHANEMAYVVTDEGGIVLVKHTKLEARAIKLTIMEVDPLRRDEKCTSPIYNYARFLPWVQAVERVSEAFESAPKGYYGHESNETQVEEYRMPLLPQDLELHSRWGPRVLSRMFVASALALMLQWGTAGAAIMDVWFTPTRGLGCRSAAYLLYTILSTLVWMLLVTSSILTHYYTVTTPGPRADHHGGCRRLLWAAKHFSIFFRRLGKVIATFNSILVVLTCVFQFGNFFNRCYCNSSIFSLRDHAYNVISLVPDDLTGVRSAWIGGVCLAAGSAILFVLFVNVYINPPPPES
ncbi:hypothetical protein BYT27DRAFT_7198646 [Phlegmacium glaucopus]|nr:hypothetical protein BYT27DRAFT_7198646 [Phlegmacium glaucopus]